MTIYEISQAIMAVYENAMDPETGEIIDEDLYEALDELEMLRDEKITNIGLWIKDIDGDAAKIREEEKRLAERRKALEKKSERLRDWMLRILDGQNFTVPNLAVSFRRSQAVVVAPDSLSKLSERFLRYKDPEPDKTAIKEALKAGEAVPGCSLEDRVSMIIK